MCGIAGLIALDPDSRNVDTVRAMSEGLAHRGPDGQGLWADPGSGTVLAHRRLAIIDLSEGGAQPMHSADGRYTVVFNGEIYNHVALRQSLAQQGAVLRSASDTEVLLELWARRGPDCLPLLRGMFAFVIWDRVDQVAWLARDGLGIKPLHYAASAGGLLFASELRAVLAAGRVERRLDPAALVEFFETGSVPEPMTLVEGVRMLEAGHLLRWQRGDAVPSVHWTLPFDRPADIAASDASTWLHTALQDSVAAHFVSDVPVAMFLSGGIDSTALLALAADAGLADQLHAFTVGVDDPALDESAAAAATARHFGVRHERLHLDVEAVATLLPEYLESIDSPSIDGFNTWVVSRLARRAGAKVALSGLGGDELFGGYPSFAAVPRLHGALAPLRVTRATQVAAAAALDRLAPAVRPRTPQVRRVAGALRRGAGMAALHRAYRGLFSPGDARRLAAHFGAGPVPLAHWHEPALPADPREAVSALEASRYMRNQLLRDSDAMSMAHGLEVRVPLVDARLYADASRVAPGLRLRAGKRMLLEAVPGVPGVVRDAPKRGFRFPFERWVAQGLAGVVPPGLPVELPAWYHRWAILVIASWMQRHGVRA